MMTMIIIIVPRQILWITLANHDNDSVRCWHCPIRFRRHALQLRRILQLQLPTTNTFPISTRHPILPFNTNHCQVDTETIISCRCRRRLLKWMVTTTAAAAVQRKRLFCQLRYHGKRYDLYQIAIGLNKKIQIPLLFVHCTSIGHDSRNLILNGFTLQGFTLIKGD